MTWYLWSFRHLYHSLSLRTEGERHRIKKTNPKVILETMSSMDGFPLESPRGMTWIYNFSKRNSSVFYFRVTLPQSRWPSFIAKVELGSCLSLFTSWFWVVAFLVEGESFRDFKRINTYSLGLGPSGPNLCRIWFCCTKWTDVSKLWNSHKKNKVPSF
jgi:hypothetical protein